jgi:hypothetical protein
MILAESFQNLFQDLEMPFVSVGVHQEVVDVDDQVLQVLSTPSMRHWNEAGHPSGPIRDVIQWNCPLPGMVKAMRG